MKLSNHKSNTVLISFTWLFSFLVHHFFELFLSSFCFFFLFIVGIGDVDSCCFVLLISLFLRSLFTISLSVLVFLVIGILVLFWCNIMSFGFLFIGSVWFLIFRFVDFYLGDLSNEFLGLLLSWFCWTQSQVSLSLVHFWVKLKLH